VRTVEAKRQDVKKQHRRIPYFLAVLQGCFSSAEKRRSGAATGGGVARVRRVLTVKIRQPSHEFTFGVGMTFVSYPLVLTPVV
jgi:hypothetical protein